MEKEATKKLARVFNINGRYESSIKGFHTGVRGISLVARDTCVHFHYAVGNGAGGSWSRSRSITKYGYTNAWQTVFKLRNEYERRKDKCPKASMVGEDQVFSLHLLPIHHGWGL